MKRVSLLAKHCPCLCPVSVDRFDSGIGNHMDYRAHGLSGRCDCAERAC